ECNFKVKINLRFNNNSALVNTATLHYIIIELSMFAGRSPATKKQLIQTLFRNIEEQCKIASQDIEITIFETPKENWGIRGKNADELLLNYQVNI
ncbi:tautomerase family protein, partial [Acinetobacter baumannii]